jgi:two-component system copper resistance phosphate regulon response regulator CusR
MKLLVVEDEPAGASFLRRGLGEEGFAVDVAARGDEANRMVAAYDYDAIVLDVMLPDRDGFDLCRGWRSQGLKTPILFLTARDDVRDRVRGLNLGADDYLVKPFAFAELLARLRALLRRGQAAPLAARLQVGDLVIDTQQRRAWRNGRGLDLTMREYQLLEHLTRNAGQVVSRKALWEHVWESHCVPDSNVVDVYIGYLRNKLGRSPDLIHTVRGGGYRLQTEAEAAAADDRAAAS